MNVIATTGGAARWITLIILLAACDSEPRRFVGALPPDATVVLDGTSDIQVSDDPLTVDAPAAEDVIATPEDAAVDVFVGRDVAGPQRCERRLGEQCSSDLACCNGIPCVGERANATCCKPVGWSCGAADECCSRRCEGGRCACSPGTDPDNARCAEDDDCCGGVNRCRVTGAPGFCCVPPQGACTSARQCCRSGCNDGRCCFRGQSSGVCESDDDCCTGLHCVVRIPGATPSCCNSHGQPCAAAVDCCNDLACLAGRCCQRPDRPCTGDGQCCNGSCVNGRCACFPNRSACTSAATCCGGGCVDGRCCSASGASCEANGDCCGAGSVCLLGFCCGAVGGRCASGRDCCSTRCEGGTCQL